MTTKATIIISFGEGVSSDNYFVIAELDDAMNLDAEGKVKSQFNPGDDVYFLVQHEAAVRMSGVRCSRGQIQSQGTVSRSQDMGNLVFTEANETKGTGYIANNLSAAFFGNSVNLSLIEGGKTIKCFGGSYPAICKADIRANFHSFRYIPPALTLTSEESYPIAIAVYMEVI
jgi:hypothetical protein